MLMMRTCPFEAVAIVVLSFMFHLTVFV